MKSFNNLLYFKQVCKNCHQAVLFCDNLSNGEMVLTAISSNYRAFEYIPKSLKRDFDFTLRCAKIAPEIINYVDSGLLHNQQWIIMAVKNNHRCFLFLSKLNPNVAKNKSLCILACDLLENIDAIDPLLFTDYEFLSRIISQNYWAIAKVLCHCKLTMTQKQGLCLKAITINEQIFCCLPEEIRNDVHFVQRAIFANVNVKNYL